MSSSWKNKLTYYDKQVSLIFDELYNSPHSQEQARLFKKLQKKYIQYSNQVENICLLEENKKTGKMPRARNMKYCYYNKPKDPKEFEDKELVVSFD